MTWSWFLILMHLVGLALGLGGATTKLVLLVRCRHDAAFVPTFLAVARPVTRLIIAGLVLLTLSGIGFLLEGYPLTSLLMAKLLLVGALWVLGPIIDRVAEPRFRSSARAGGGSWTSDSTRAYRSYLALEGIATALFYLIVALWLRA